MSQGSTKGVPIDTDSTFTLNSDQVVPSQKAVKSAFAAWIIDLASRATGILPKANGGTGITTPRTIAQIVTNTTSALASGTTTIPADDTIPQQSTEGNEFITLSITPTNSNSLLEIDCQCALGASVVSVLSMALFQDSTANALKTAWQTMALNDVTTLHINHQMTAGTTSATTFKIKAGLSAAGTCYLNGVAGSRYFGGTMNSYIKITEYLP